MTFKHSLKTAFSGLSTHKSRSMLTVLGIVIGITAIILIMSLGRGAQNLILGQIQGMGTKTVTVIPGRQPKGPADFSQSLSDSLKERDLEALKKKSNVPTLTRIMPLVFGSETAVYGSETHRPNIFGATDLISEMLDIQTEAGSFFTDEDVKASADVAIIGYKVREELFGQSKALGEKIKIKGRNFRVVGILPQKGQVSLLSFDDAVIVPYTTAQKYIFGIKHFHRLVVEAESESAVPRTVRDIEITLRDLHNIGDPSKDDFFVETQADVAETLSTITSVLTLFLTSVAAISLVVGGIGIMNIMLVSVTERTREIGLRKALGATDGNILTQFLLEAILLTGFGGIIGISLGAFFSFIASVVLTRAYALDWAFSLPLSAVLIGVSVATAIGLVFGIYPASQASRKSPMEALRYE